MMCVPDSVTISSWVRPLAVNIIERELRNKIEDDWMNALMVCYTEKEIFKPLDDETIT
jgi:hypothetical protein